jgi:membrane protein required for colicin V production
MTWADALIIAVVLLSAIAAAAQGFLHEVISLAGVIAGYLLAAWGYHAVAPWFAPYVSSPWVANLAGFFTIFAAVVVLAGIAARIARWSMKEVGLRWFDRLLGGVFGLVRGVLVVMVVVLALASFGPGSTLLARSRIAPYLLVLARGAVWVAPAQVRQQFSAGMDALRDLRQGGAPPSTPATKGR